MCTKFVCNPSTLKKKKEQVALLVSVHCSSEPLCTGVEHIHAQWSPVTLHVVLNFGDARENQPLRETQWLVLQLQHSSCTAMFWFKHGARLNTTAVSSFGGHWPTVRVCLSPPFQANSSPDGEPCPGTAPLCSHFVNELYSQPAWMLWWCNQTLS